MIFNLFELGSPIHDDNPYSLNKSLIKSTDYHNVWCDNEFRVLSVSILVEKIRKLLEGGKTEILTQPSVTSSKDETHIIFLETVFDNDVHKHKMIDEVSKLCKKLECFTH